MPAPYDPVPVLNKSGEDIPSHAVVEPTGTITDGAFEVRKPTRSGNRAVLVNGPGVIPKDAAGQAYAAPRVVAQCDGEPGVGDEWGAKAGGWQLARVGGGGFLFLGGYAGGRGNFVRYGATAAGSGSGAGGSCYCELETVRFDVVTNVVCTPSGGLAVTRQRISITGCNLSISGAATPSGAGGGPVSPPAAFCYPEGTVVCLSVPDGPNAGSYTGTVDSGGGANIMVAGYGSAFVNMAVTPPELVGVPATASVCAPEPVYAVFAWASQAMGATSDYALTAGPC